MPLGPGKKRERSGATYTSYRPRVTEDDIERVVRRVFDDVDDVRIMPTIGRGWHFSVHALLEGEIYIFIVRHILGEQFLAKMDPPNNDVQVSNVIGWQDAIVETGLQLKEANGIPTATHSKRWVQEHG